MSTTRSTLLLAAGDELVRQGAFKEAAAAYSRFADACMAEGCLRLAKNRVQDEPVEALRVLAEAERLQGATGEGRRLSAAAYRRLGHAEIAAAFQRAS